MKYKYLVILLVLILIPSLVLASQVPTRYGFNLLPGTTFDNDTAFVNSSGNWITTTLGVLSNANTTQFNNNAGTLTLDPSWLTSFGNTEWLRLDGTNSPTATISWGNQDLNNIKNITAVNYFGKGSALTLEVIGSPIFSTIQDLQNTFHSSGVFNSNATVNFIILNDDNTFNVTKGSGTIRAIDNATTTLFFFDWIASNNILISLNEIIYVGVEWNAGSPQIITKSTNTWDMQMDFPLGSIVRDVSGVHLQRSDHAVGDHANNMIQRLFSTNPFTRGVREGGLILGTDGRNITMTTGVIWEKLNKFNIPAIDTGGSDTFDRYYKNGSGGWFAQIDSTEWNNTHYDDGTGTLNELGNNKFSVEWVYLEVDGEIVTVFGQEEFNNIGEVSGSSPPSSVPPRVEIHAKLIGRIIFKKGATNSSSTESVFVITFTVAGITDHGNLAGLSDDDHTQYISADGSRELTALWNYGSFGINGSGNFTITGNITADTYFGNISSNLIQVDHIAENTLGIGIMIDNNIFMGVNTLTTSEAILKFGVSGLTELYYARDNDERFSFRPANTGLDQFDLGITTLRWHNLWLAGDANVIGVGNFTGDIFGGDDLDLIDDITIGGDMILGSANSLTHTAKSTNDVIFQVIKEAFGSIPNARIGTKGDDTNAGSNVWSLGSDGTSSFVIKDENDARVVLEIDSAGNFDFKIGNLTANTYFGSGSQLTGIIHNINGTHINVLTINSTDLTVNGNLNVTKNFTIGDHMRIEPLDFGGGATAIRFLGAGGFAIMHRIIGAQDLDGVGDAFIRVFDKDSTNSFAEISFDSISNYGKIRSSTGDLRFESAGDFIFNDDMRIGKSADTNDPTARLEVYGEPGFDDIDPDAFMVLNVVGTDGVSDLGFGSGSGVGGWMNFTTGDGADDDGSGAGRGGDINFNLGIAGTGGSARNGIMFISPNGVSGLVIGTSNASRLNVTNLFHVEGSATSTLGFFTLSDRNFKSNIKLESNSSDRNTYSYTINMQRPIFETQTLQKISLICNISGEWDDIITCTNETFYYDKKVQIGTENYDSPIQYKLMADELPNKYIQKQSGISFVDYDSITADNYVDVTKLQDENNRIRTCATDNLDYKDYRTCIIGGIVLQI